MSVEFGWVVVVLRKMGDGGDRLFVEEMEGYSKRMREGIWEYGVVMYRKYGRVFVYEVDGFGSVLMMDDVNYLLFLVLLLMGFVGVEDEVY